MQETQGDASLIPGLGRAPGGGNGDPLQYSPGKSPHREAWWATVIRIAKSWTQLSYWACNMTFINEFINELIYIIW